MHKSICALRKCMLMMKKKAELSRSFLKMFQEMRKRGSEIFSFMIIG